MTARDFVFWLQGLFELTDVKTLTEKQTTLIKAHLNMVFKHEIDPAMGDAQHQEVLNNIHNSTSQDPGPPPAPGMVHNIHGWQNPGELLRC